jgi:hypothetical protein
MPAAAQGKRTKQVKAGNKVDTTRSRPDDTIRKQDLKGRPMVETFLTYLQSIVCLRD